MKPAPGTPQGVAQRREPMARIGFTSKAGIAGCGGPIRDCQGRTHGVRDVATIDAQSLQFKYRPLPTLPSSRSRNAVQSKTGNEYIDWGTGQPYSKIVRPR